MNNNPLPRLDKDSSLRQELLQFCRLQSGEIWIDQISGHKVGCFDSTDKSKIIELMSGEKASLALYDPPYNFIAFQEDEETKFIEWSKKWINLTQEVILDRNSSLYVWLGADQKNHFQPLPAFMIMMRDTAFKSRSFITMRNQRGFGTQKNWMSIRQECLYYTLGEPLFNVEAEYTDIPKILRGYYKKDANGNITENGERSKSENIRAGNVWVDIQQVFYRMEENVNGCYVQKPLKSCERIIRASSNKGDLVIDLFGHSGSTLISCEQLKRKCFIVDIDPIYCEIMIRRLENFRETGRTGWQNSHAFEKEFAQIPKKFS